MVIFLYNLYISGHNTVIHLYKEVLLYLISSNIDIIESSVKTEFKAIYITGILLLHPVKLALRG